MKTARTAAVIALTFCASAFALDPSLDVSQYAHTSWKVRDGFTKGGLASIAQTPDGYLWLGTEFGLYRFDGVRAVAWQPPAGHQLPSNYVMSLLSGRDGTLWIGTWSGLASWKGGALTTYPQMAGRGVGRLLEDRAGTVWVGRFGLPSESFGRLCAVREGRIQCWVDNGSWGIAGLYEDASDTLWVGGADGFWRWKPRPPQFFSLPDARNGIRTFAESDKGALLIGGDDGIKQLVHGQMRAYPLIAPLQGSLVEAMLRDRDGGLWVGTSDRGLVHVHNGNADVFSQADGLTGNFVTSLFEDREGNIWVATANGLDRFRAYSIPTLSAKQGLPKDFVWSILAAKDGSVWIAALGALSRWGGGKISAYGRRPAFEKPDGTFAGKSPNSLFQDSDGRIWVSTLREFGYLRDGGLVSVNNFPGGIVHSIAEVPSGNLWVSNQKAGLIHLTQGRVVQQFPWATLGHKDHANVLAADPSQRGLWLGFYLGGVAHFLDGGIRSWYSTAQGLGRGSVSDLRFGADDTLWAATEGGLSRIKDGHVATLTSKNGLPCDAVNWSMEDDDRDVWLYMPCGLVRISRSELEAWASNPARIVKISLFDASDGVRTHALAGGFTPHVTKTGDGKLWFLPWDGVSVIDPHHLSNNRIPPPVHIEQITADGKIYTAANGLRLPPHVRDLTIDYTALSLTVPEKVHFRYKLEGQDREWREVVNDRQVQYSNLPPNDYRFRVIASNNSGVWNEQGATLNFSIAPAFYQTNWFRALAVAASLLVLWGLYRLRVQQLRRQQKKLRDVIETIPTFAWTALPDGTLDFMNRHREEYMGLAGWEMAVHPADLSRHMEKWRASLATGEPFENEVRFRRASDGQYRWFLARAVPLRDARGRIVKWYGISTDIEDRKNAEQERERLRADLAHVNRVSMMGELAASLSHELKQPIAATILNADAVVRWLTRDEPDVDKAREATTRIIKDGARATEIIDRLRALYKKAPPQHELVDIDEIVGEMVVLLRGEASQHAVSIRTDLAPDLPKITADRVQLQQVLMNLMLNAIEAMKETGGVLTVKTQLGEHGELLISVSDTGVGLPAEKTDEIFNAFFTTKPHGSGMGLAISRSIVESHAGRLWATPNDGRGATFHFTLPATAEAEGSATGT